MAKPKKEKKPRPDKYAEKVAISVDFEQTMHLFAAHANSTVKAKTEQATEQELELDEA